MITNFKDCGKRITAELDKTLDQISSEDVEKLANKILDAKHVFVAGAGRSGFMVRAFAMRLMHMGFTAYVIGEAITPNLEKQGLLIIGSGSGATSSLVSMAKNCKKIGADLAVITIFPDSPIGQMADVVVKIPAPTPKSEKDSGFTSIQPMGTLFEQSLLLLLDAVIIILMAEKGYDSNTMFTRHANIE